MKKNWNVLIDGRNLNENEIVNAILSSRGITDIPRFFYPTEDELIPFHNLKNIDKAYYTVMNCIDKGWHVIIHADVDADGCTSAAIMYRYLKNYTDDITLTINDGKMHGIHNDYRLYEIKENTLLIVVDSINENYNIIYDFATANKLNVQMIILDHHIVPKNFDSRPILVSSANGYENPQLSGAGVCLKFCQYIDFNELECYADDLYDLAACGMVADMVDMTIIENRYIVDRGLRNLKNPGISAVIGNYAYESQSISFSIAPLVNAACRTYNNIDALNLFIEDDVDKVYQIIEKLRDCKAYQDKVVSDMMSDIVKQNESQVNDKVSVFYIEPRNDVSVAGLIGNKLCDKLQKPVLVLNKGDVLIGSARAIGIDNFIDICREQNVEFSDGHELAFGIGIKKENMLSVKNGLEQALKNVEFIDSRTIDIELEPNQIDRSLIEKLKFYNRVTGENFKPITVCVKGISNAESKPMGGGRHMRMKSHGMNFIKWNCKDDMTGRKFDAYGTLDSAYWGRSWNINLIMEDYLEV